MIPRRKATDVYTVTDARRPMSEDINYRQKRYLVSMSIRTVCLLAGVLLAGHAPFWIILILLAGAIVLPYISVVFANGGREPDRSKPLYSDETANQKQISGPRPEIRP